MELVLKSNLEELERLEGIIRRNLQSFYEVGRALMEIRDKGLYRDVLGFATFEAYCREKWDMGRNYANKLISSSQVIDNLGTIVHTAPATETQTRPLARLEPEKQREAWQKAVETAPEGKVTAAIVSKVVHEMTATQEIVTKASPEEDSDVLFHLKRYWKHATKKDKKAFAAWVEGQK